MSGSFPFPGFLPFTLPLPGQPACPCSVAAVHHVEWECPSGHPGVADLCLDHAAVHVGALLSGEVMCAVCRRDGHERAVALKKVDGRTVDPRLSRRTL